MWREVQGGGGSKEPNEEEREGKKGLEGIGKKSGGKRGGEEWRKLGGGGVEGIR